MKKKKSNSTTSTNDLLFSIERWNKSSDTNELVPIEKFRLAPFFYATFTA
jgi:hypothetical protein